jgi:uncharacterized protein (DUF2141 family)
MRWLYLFRAMVLFVGAQMLSAQSPTYTLTVVVDGVSQADGNVGMLVFNSDKGWPDDRKAALRDIAVESHPGTNTIEVPNLPAGDYAVAVIHDVNKNHKLDKNFLGVPTEQWGMSTNPSHGLKAPSFDSVKFSLKGNQEIHIKVQ